MSTVVVVEDEIYDENYGSWWWIFLITGTLWLILSLIMFRFNLSSAKSIGVLAGIVFLIAGAFEFALVAVVSGGWWKALNAILGVLLVAGRDLLVHPPEGHVHRDRPDHRVHVPVHRDHGPDHRLLQPHGALVAADDLRVHLHRPWRSGPRANSAARPRC